ncbi:flagellar filament capping protein FliD [Paenarthrobacter sp. DKR-5]|uniref:flagellar filament capping protein FliD n=1 Tax=Paenarthrobacter sp. DKR-5 TaxID=2835535 RepID=UPI001BDC52B4|nr:flagellar filament capping protein FliD [Paenarthrobacter sp. DKR-5]MBT1004465.1 flagellar filament capping protein FliD [Paenarthrobacter sp. DKR-5]
MATSISGLGSGLDTASIINSLMAVEALPQQMLQSKQSADQSLISSLQTLKSFGQPLLDMTAKMTAPGGTSLFTATSSSTSVTATAGAGAATGSFSVTFDQLAQTQVDVTAPMSVWPTDATGMASAITLVDASGKTTEITPPSTSIDDVVTAINSVGGPATAVKVPAGNGTYRIQLTSSKSGAAGAFQAYLGTAADVSAGTATDLMSQTGAAVVTTAQDASARLYAGTAAETTITSSTNTFTNILPGVNVTASATSASPVTITVASDTAGISKQASDLVDKVNGMLSYISSNSAVTATTNTAGGSTATGGVFTGNSSISDVTDQMTNALYMPTSNGHSPSDMGISINQDGSFTFDSTKFASAMAADPSGTQAALQEIAGRVSTAAKNFSDPVTGSVTQLISGQQSEVADLTNQISDWDTRLSDRRATLTAMFNAMDGSVGALKSQQSWLASQIANLPTIDTSSSSGK